MHGSVAVIDGLTHSKKGSKAIMKKKKVIAMLMAMAVAITSVSVYTTEPVFAADTTTTVTGETPLKQNYVFGTMNIPYNDFYKAEIGDSNQVEIDSVTSATASKWKTQAGSYSVADAEGQGGTILGTVFYVAIEKDVYEALKKENSTLLESFVESQTVPENYKVMNAEGKFSFAKAKEVILKDVATTFSTSSNYGDYQIDIKDLKLSGTLCGVVVTTTDGTKYGMRHLENIWKNGQEISWGSGYKTKESHGNTLSSAHYESMAGKTIASLTYITTEGVYVVSDINTYVPLKYHDAEVQVEDSTIEAGKTSYVLTGFPEAGDWKLSFSEGLTNGEYKDGMITYGSDSKPGNYTVTVSDATGKYADTTATFELKTSVMPVKFENDAIVAVEGKDATDYLKNITRVTVTLGEQTKNYSASGKNATKIMKEDGGIDFEAGSGDVFTESGCYEITVVSAGYDDLTFQVLVDYTYGTMNISYGDFYAAEIGTTNPVAVDAVTSATNAKWKKFNGSYTQPDAEGEGGKILGAKYNVAIESRTLAELKATNNSLLDSFVEIPEKPASYKILTKAGNFTTAKGISKEAEGVTAKLSTNSVWGDYQLELTGLTVDVQQVAGVVIETAGSGKQKGTVYGLRHEENIWLQAHELSWASGFKTTEPHGNTLSSAHYESMMGKTITKVTYICTDGNITISNLNIYVPIKYNSTLKIDNAAVDTKKTAVTMEGYPKNGDWQIVLPETLKDGVYTNSAITYSDKALPGSYTVTVKDASGVYVDSSASFVISTSVLPVEFKNGTIVDNGTGSEAAANYLKNISTVTVKKGDKEASYAASGRGAVIIIDENGAVNLDAAYRNEPVFAETGSYDLTIEATGYPQLTFAVEKTATVVSPMGTVTPVVTKAPTKLPTKAPTKVPTKKPTATPTVKVTAPKKITISKTTNLKGKKLKVTWRKNQNVAGYQVQVAANKKFTSGKKTYTIKKAATTSKTITGLKKGKTYYVRVRGYKLSGKVKVWGSYSSIKKVTIKK